ncbi:hypothetical protein DN069_19020 [Streptacidiphilus pinicola]|uniref:Uncharacterized protein n=1 Tax=Streptacidiphilus pinicola TaxID=2219663 RepID=A0A2X0IG21_9ACTN|nr:hypothetical protein DN069_19020 [Streptacidiphilus pinicola]
MIRPYPRFEARSLNRPRLPPRRPVPRPRRRRPARLPDRHRRRRRAPPRRTAGRAALFHRVKPTPPALGSVPDGKSVQVPRRPGGWMSALSATPARSGPSRTAQPAAAGSFLSSWRASVSASAPLPFWSL